MMEGPSVSAADSSGRQNEGVGATSRCLQKSRTVTVWPSRAVLQDPVRLFTQHLARELNVRGSRPDRAVARLLQDNPQAAIVCHIAKEFLTAAQRLLILENLRAFQWEHADLGTSEATECYAALMRTKRIPLSRSTLYAWAAEFDRSGLAGLVPSRHGGRPRRVSAIDLSILRMLLQDTPNPPYRLYIRFHRSYNLPSKPITRTIFPLVVADLKSAKRSARRRAVRRGPAKPAGRLTTIDTPVKKTA